MGRNQPPFSGLPPGVPMSAMLAGAPRAAPSGPPFEARRIVPRDKVQQAIYNAAAVLAQARAQVLQSLSMLSDTHLACKQTVEHGASLDGPILVGDSHMSAEKFAEKFQLARQEDADAVGEALRLLRKALDSIPDADVSELADRRPEK